ncbi:cysteine desulfurase [Haliangium sp.]|uniref:cysteine desulfurase n=1 Tax=Haliangium sp. TaxID=2663208 RepID=UPI003D11B37E
MPAPAPDSPDRPSAVPALDLARLRADFPALAQEVRGQPLVYLDSAATALKPQAVIDAVTRVYARDCANVHRGVHLLSQRATEAYEAVRAKVQGLLGAADPSEIVFVRGTTEAINLVAQSWARPRLGPGDEILITGLEHHANIVPWQMVCEQTGASLRVVPITDAGAVQLEDVDQALGERTRVVAVAHVSNALGTVLPVRAIADRAHAVGAKLLVDGAQAVPHMEVDVTALGCDFYCFSAHKVYGPTGVGALWAPRAVLEEMSPYQGGGDMIRSVSFERTTYAPPPHKFEAGTPNIAGTVGMGAAIDYLAELDRDALHAHEQALLDYATQALSEIPGLRLWGTAAAKLSVLSFTMDAAHPHDIGTIVDSHGVAIRTGHHCAQPVMTRFGIPATARASLSIYNTREDVDALVRALLHVQEMFG